MEEYYKSVLDQDDAPVVLCNLKHVILYMNETAVKRYEKEGGRNLLGKSLMNCHTSYANEMIEKVLDWFREDKSHNKIYTFDNREENKDVYMVALRDENQNLIGYYEKHEYRSKEEGKLYDFR